MKIYILLTVLLLSLNSIYSQTPEEAVGFLENENGVGTRAQAMGNAFTAVADDYSATYFNPAGLTLLKTHELSGDLYHLKLNNQAVFEGNTLNDDRTFSKFRSLGLAYRFPTTQGSFVLSFGYNRFKDYDDFLYFNGYSPESNGLEFELEDDEGNLDYYPFDRDVLQSEEIYQEGNLSAWSIAGGIELSPSFALGATVNFYSGKSRYLFDFYQDDIDNVYNEYPANYATYELHNRIDSKFAGWGLKVGGLFHLSKTFRLGLAIDLPSTLEVSERYASNDALYFDDEYSSELDLGSGEWLYLVKYPYKVSGGIALDMNDLLVAGSFDYRDWSQVEFDIPGEFEYSDDYDDLLSENNFFPELFRATFSYAAGAEYRFKGSGLKLRGGYRYVPSPLLDEDEKLKREYYSIGFGYDIDKNATLNFSYTTGKWKRSSFDSYTPSGTSEKVESTRFSAGITFKM
jgi:long-subunit fatty acid transport protein